jgi:radical SAM superfamily enzyme YgiQ (UPF0313 family)
MKIGVLELLTGVRTEGWREALHQYYITKQYASIMPQAISVWCRQMGHHVSYAAYYGNGDPRRLLPDGLDVVFIGFYTKASALGYALAKLFRQEKTFTVAGGPHAKSFPHDTLRFFDLVVKDCDKTLLKEILQDRPNRQILTSGRTLADIPSVEERMPEIRASAFSKQGKPYLSTTIPMLASVGCPYSCNFCIDWNSPYTVLPLDRLKEDLRFISRELPGIKVAFHDPNFGVRFDETLEVLEAMPKADRNPYVVESSLSVLRGDRMRRLKETNCLFIAPGIESWSSYSNKAGVGRRTGHEKMRQVAEHVRQLHEYVPGIQINFIFGLDTDQGDGPVELTKEFMDLTPFAWPVINVPVPFGGTPLYDQLLKEGRILEAMPFSFYTQVPYLVSLLKNYQPLDFYQKTLEMMRHSATTSMLRRRLLTTPSWSLRAFFVTRNLRIQQEIKRFRKIIHVMSQDSQMVSFHQGNLKELPEFYHRVYEQMLGPYAPLISRQDRRPLLVPTDVQAKKPEPAAAR